MTGSANGLDKGLLSGEAPSAANAPSLARMATRASSQKHTQDDSSCSYAPPSIAEAAASAAASAGTLQTEPLSPTQSASAIPDNYSQTSDTKHPASTRIDIPQSKEEQQKFINALVEEIKLNTDPLLEGYKNKLIWCIALYCGVSSLSTAYDFGQDFCTALDNLGLGKMSPDARFSLSIACAVLGGGTDLALDTVSILNILSRFDFKKAWKEKDAKTIAKIIFIVIPSMIPNIKSGLDHNAFGGKKYAPVFALGRGGAAGAVNGKYTIVDQPRKTRIPKDDPAIKMITKARKKLNEAKQAMDTLPATFTQDYVLILENLVNAIKENNKKTKLNPTANSTESKNTANSEELHRTMKAVQAMAKVQNDGSTNEDNNITEESPSCFTKCVSKLPWYLAELVPDFSNPASVLFSTVASLQFAMAGVQFVGYKDLADLFTSEFSLSSVAAAYLAVMCFKTNYNINQVAYLDLAEKVKDRWNKGLSDAHWDSKCDAFTSIMKETFFGSANIAYGIIYASYAYQYPIYENIYVKSASGLCALPVYIGLGKLTTDDGRNIYSAMRNKKLLAEALNADQTGAWNGAMKTNKSLSDYFDKMSASRQKDFLHVAHRYVLTLFETLEDYFYKNPSQNVLADSFFKEIEREYPPQSLVPSPKAAATDTKADQNTANGDLTESLVKTTSYTTTSYSNCCVRFFRALCGRKNSEAGNIVVQPGFQPAVPTAASAAQQNGVYAAATPNIGRPSQRKG